MKNFKKTSMRHDTRSNAAAEWPKDLLAIAELEPRQVQEILWLAQQVKDSPCTYQGALSGSHTVLLFEKPSLRTRLTFEIGVQSMGGSVTFVDCQSQRLDERESVKDIARNLERWCSVLVARTFSHEILRKLAEYSSIPVINALSDVEHPCQALADLFTLRQRWKDVSGRRLVYVGDPNNVSNSLMLICAMLGVHFTLISPPQYEADAELRERAAALSKQTGSNIECTHDLGRMFGADAIYTDVWTSMGREDESERRRRDFAAYQITPQLMARAGKKALFMHCLPAHRGEEVSDGVIDGPRSVVYEQAENRLHVHKAVLLKALHKD
jgi:ornithine carbamoyltransferase